METVPVSEDRLALCVSYRAGPVAPMRPPEAGPLRMRGEIRGGEACGTRRGLPARLPGAMWFREAGSPVSERSCLLVIDKRVHQQPLIDELLPLGFLVGQVPVVVIGHDDPVRLESQLHDEPVVVAHHSPSLHSPRRREHQDLLLLKLAQDLLICGNEQGGCQASTHPALG